MKELDYQNKAVQQLKRALEREITDNTYNEDQVYNKIILEAITGSGKTIIMTKLIDSILQEYQDFSFIWFSPGKGDLHIQSKLKVESNIKLGTCKILDESYIVSNDFIQSKDILFTNWETLNRKSNDESKTSKIMRDSDNRNFPELIAETKKRKGKIILIIDEFHTTSNTERSKEIIDLIDPYFVYYVSATPRNIPNSQKPIKVDKNEVIEAGMIKEKAILQSDLKPKQNETSKQSILRTALEKQKQLEALYLEEKSSVKPLIIIQVPDKSKNGDGMIKECEEYLSTLNINYGNKTLSKWLSGEKINIEEINIENSPVKVLIFKQAITEGWDCPRAQILCKFRDTSNNETFSIQVLGRIFRMPECHHYENKALNIAYVYTDLNDTQIEIVKEDENQIVKSKDIELKIANLKIDMSLPDSAYKEHILMHNKFKSKIQPFLNKQLNMKKNKLNIYKLGKKEILGDGEITIDDNNQYTQTTNNTTIKCNESPTELEFNAEKRISLSCKDNNLNSKDLQNDIFEFIKKYIKKTNNIKSDTDCYLIMSHEKNKDKIENIIKNTLQKYKPNEIKIKLGTWNLESKDYANYIYNNLKLELIELKNYALDKCYVRIDSTQEREFLKLLNNKKDIIGIYRNGTYDRYCKEFGIKMEDSIFFPDFIVKFKDGKYGIYDTKPSNNFNIQDCKDKYKVLLEYKKNHEDIIEDFGFITQKTNWYIFNFDGEYVNYDDNNKNWQLFK